MIPESMMDMLPLLIPLFVLEMGLMVFALVDLIKRKRVTGNNKVVWALLIIFVSVIGPIVYLAMGRKEALVDSD